jgi:hypothetical protein
MSKSFARWLTQWAELDILDPHALALMVARDPQLLDEVALLTEPETYMASDAALLVLAAARQALGSESPPALEALVDGLKLSCSLNLGSLDEVLRATSQTLALVQRPLPDLVRFYSPFRDE